MFAGEMQAHHKSGFDVDESRSRIAPDRVQSCAIAVTVLPNDGAGPKPVHRPGMSRFLKNTPRKMVICSTRSECSSMTEKGVRVLLWAMAFTSVARNTLTSRPTVRHINTKPGTRNSERALGTCA
jgi:hypothetical protein